MADPHLMNVTEARHFRTSCLFAALRSTVAQFLSLLIIPAQILVGQIEHPAGLNPRKALTQYTKESWETGKTPLEGAIRAIHQSRDGYIWLGTQEGLYRYDGERFVAYNAQNTPEFRNSAVYALAEDTAGVLWVATRDGLLQYSAGVFRRFSLKDGLTSTSLLSLCVDRQGSLWIGSMGGGMMMYANGQFRQHAQEGDLRYGSIWSILCARDSSIWIGTSGAGVARLKGGREERYTARGGLLTDVIRSLAESRDGSIWVGTHLGINRIFRGKISSSYQTVFL